MSRLAASVAIATTDGVAGKAGATISTLSPVSAETPPSLLVCLHHKTSVAQKIQANNTFAVNMLDETQRALAQLFASQPPHPQGKNKFDHTQQQWQQTFSGAWKLQDALGFFDCEVLQALRYQSHFVVIGKVLNIEIGSSDRKPLLYANRAYTMLSGPSPSDTSLRSETCDLKPAI